MKILSIRRHAVIVAIMYMLTGSVNLLNAQVVNYINPINSAGRTIDPNMPVGSTEGMARVSEGGAATFQIPVFCSPGTGGMQPSLSIVYNSQSGNGSLGWGFELFGLSSVSRVQKTMIQDDSLSEVRMAKSDVFALDGNRLYIKSGIYGANMATYETEIATFSNITSNGTTGNGPQWFKVITADGAVNEYGNSTDSRTIKTTDNNGAIGLWRLNRVTDINGNYMTCEYDLQSGLITRIAYTGNVAAGLTPYNEIVFLYALRSDWNITYPYNNAPVADRHLLTDILIKSEGSLVKKYHFNYNCGANDVHSLLNEIVESDASGNALNSTVMDWGDKLNTGGNSMTVEEAMVPQESFNPCLYALDSYSKSEIDKIPSWWAYDLQQKRLNEIMSPIIMKNKSGRIFGDFDGDGYLDVINIRARDVLSPLREVIEWKFYARNNGGYDPNVLPDAGGDIAHLLTSLFVVQSAVADINGDGKDELFLSICDPAKTQNVGEDSIDMVCYQLLNNSLVELPQFTLKNMYARGFEPGYQASVAYADLDGDRNANDIIVHAGYNDHNYFYNSLPYTNNYTLPTPALDITGDFEVIDLNGNGKPDIMQKSVVNGLASYKVFEKSASQWRQTSNFTFSLTADDPLYPGDYNGDGKTDFLYYQKAQSQWILTWSNGKSPVYNYPALLPDLNSLDNANIIYSVLSGDYNGDGKTDVLVYTSNPATPGQAGNVKIYYSWGINFKMFDYGTPAIPGFYSLDAKAYDAGDVNNDGQDEIYFRRRVFNGDACSGTYSYICSFDKNKQPLLVKSVMNGFNQITSFSYKKLTDPTVYTRGNNTDPRFIDLKSPLYVASQMSQPNGIGGVATTTYSYGGGLLHKYGKGFLGYSSVTAANQTSGALTETTYSIDPATLMIYPAQVKNSMNGNLVSQIQNVFSYVACSGLNGHGYYKGLFPFTSKTTETDALSGIIKTTTYNYGTATNVAANKGNPLSIATTYGSDGSETTIFTYSTATYTVNMVPMSLTKPATVQHSRTATGQAAFVKKTTYSYNTNGRLWKTTEWANQTKTILTTCDYTGNNFGLPVKITTSTTGIADRFVNYTYDSKGRFVLSETNMLGQTTSYQYHSAFGLKKAITDIAGNTTSNLIDGFGRVKQENQTNGAINYFYLKWDNSVNHAMWYTEEKRANAPDSKTWYDALGRQVFRTTEGFNGALVITEKEYNANGQLYRESKPHYGNELPKWITYTYQPNTGRIASVNDDGLLTAYAYSGKTITVTDPAGRNSSKTINSFGQVITATDNGGSITTVYFSNGKPKSVTTNGSALTFTYDVYANQTTQVDPNSGTTTTASNVYGELISEKDARGNLYSYAYDNAGRLATKTGPEGVYTYSYIATGNGKGKLASVTAPSGSTAYSYNSFGLPLTVSEIIDGTTYTFNYAYDNYLNNTAITYPNGLTVVNDYNNYGQMVGVKANGAQVWKQTAVNAMGQILEEWQGNGITTNYSYDQRDRLSLIRSDVQKDEYTYEASTGNMLSRSNHLINLTETFTYDNLDRLTAIKMNNVTVKAMSYAAGGNISSKTDAGTYVYDAVKKNAVKRITATGGNTAIPTLTQDVAFNAFNKIKHVSENNKKIILTYGPAQQRSKMEMYNGTTLTKTRVYCGLYEKEIMPTGVTKDYCYIATTNGITAVAISGVIYYLRKDGQGSITGLIDGNRNRVEEYSYDAWGRRRNPQTWSYTGFAAPGVLCRGYTFHEHLDDFGLINMNGRCYDPVAGRFLSPDPVLQAPANTQNYNRYSYCLNNPLKYTDPSGYRFGTGNEVGEMMQSINNSLQQKFNNWYCGMKYSVMMAQMSKRSGHGGGGTSANSVSNASSPYGNIYANYGSILPGIVSSPSAISTMNNTINTVKLNSARYSGYVNWVGTCQSTFESNDGVTWLTGVVCGSKKIEGENFEDIYSHAKEFSESLEKDGYLVANSTVGGLAHIVAHDAEIAADGLTGLIKGAKFLSYVAAGVEGVYVAINAYNAIQSNKWGDYAKTANSAGILATMYIPVVGPLVNFTLTVTDMAGGFSGIYDWFNMQQNFYNTNGYLVVPTGNPNAPVIIILKP